MKSTQIASNVHQISLGFVNAYAIQNPEQSWVLIDTGVAFSAAAMKDLAGEFGGPPAAIVLTHGHFDHAGNARELAEHWSVKIYASHLERPFLVGKSMYPPADPTVGGPLALMTRVIPQPMFNFTGLLEEIPASGHLDFLHGWQILETPGHTPGHVSLWREEDRVLIAGDALATADFDSYIGMTTQKKQFSRGGSPFTPDWVASKTSVGKLADLEPSVVGAGHGQPISGADVPTQMREFERHFHPPQHGRYVETPAHFDENGLVDLPPAPKDHFTRNAAALTGAASVLMVGAKLLSRRK
ncbi:Glyoxylase, beta-lactamase superfamily II [Abditibacterium utsteinense]|uniref:Glyoxylase, beta-lactamase superfamily II n=1 Tax=Abditibacterium utsteinense TaxID=1960156 RepID=A0A2S8SU37_9BACT|nr:MBL fold metallo-hydrolase [Abditibacterium utsteinense]PQV64323.1 Glyoxylase, beta-lactamase superfamily II [Abditibacterium utsteinense]